MNLRDLANRLVQQKKLTNDDLLEIMLIDPVDDSVDEVEKSCDETIREISDRVSNHLLQKMQKMAQAIDIETSEKRKNRMLEIYDETERDFERWRKYINIDS